MYSLANTIISLPKIIGCEDFPKSEHGKLLIEDIERFINDHYRMNGKQIVTAFEMAATHSLYLDGKRVDPSTFGKFLSRASVGKILTAYKESKQSIKARPSGYNFNQLPSNQTKNISDEDAWELVLTWAKKEGKPPFGAPYLGAYRYLLKNKQIRPVNGQPSNRFEANHSGKEKEAVEAYLLQNVLNRKTEKA